MSNISATHRHPMARLAAASTRMNSILTRNLSFLYAPVNISVSAQVLGVLGYAAP